MITKDEVVHRIEQLDEVLTVLNNIRSSELRELEAIERKENV